MLLAQGARVMLVERLIDAIGGIRNLLAGAAVSSITVANANACRIDSYSPGW
jgi:hypothetical protein